MPTNMNLVLDCPASEQISLEFLTGQILSLQLSQPMQGLSVVYYDNLRLTVNGAMPAHSVMLELQLAHAPTFLSIRVQTSANANARLSIGSLPEIVVGNGADQV
jgi:hypothetical protein